MEIVQHGGVHVHELQRARRHVDRECRPHAERRREQRQRSRGEDGRSRQEAVVRALYFSGPRDRTRSCEQYVLFLSQLLAQLA